MQPKQTESAIISQFSTRRERREAERDQQFASRRDRRQAEGHIRYSDDQKAMLETTHEYLAQQYANVKGNMANKALYPDYPIYSVVDQQGNSVFDTDNGHGTPVEVTDDLNSHLHILSAYEDKLRDPDSDASREILTQAKWASKKVEQAKAETVPTERSNPALEKKIGHFIGRRLAEARHFWLNTKTTQLKETGKVEFAHPNSSENVTTIHHDEKSEHRHAA